MNTSLDQITEAVEGNSFYQVGMEICEVCDNAMHPSGCYDAVNNCGTEGYEQCVGEILLEYILCGHDPINLENIDENLYLRPTLNDEAEACN